MRAAQKRVERDDVPFNLTALALLDDTVKLRDTDSHRCEMAIFRWSSVRTSAQPSCHSPRLALPGRIQSAYRQTRRQSKGCVENCHAHVVYCHAMAIRFILRTVRRSYGRARRAQSEREG